MKTVAVIEGMSVDVYGCVYLSLAHHSNLCNVSIKDIKAGGKNLEVKDIRVGGKIAYDSIGLRSHSLIGAVIISDGTKEVDLEGNLIKW